LKNRLTILYDTQSFLQRDLIKLARNPTLFGTLLVEPLVLFLVFSQVFQKLSLFLPGSSGGYLGFLTPGIVLISALVCSPQSGISLANDLNSGLLSKMLLTPADRPAILLGRLLTDVLVVTAQSTLTIVVAIALGVRIATGMPGVLLILFTVAYFELALSGIFLAVGMKTRKTETLNALSGFLFLPVIFFSSAMFPVSFLPSWAQAISNYNPVSYASAVIRELVQGGLSVGTLTTAYVAIGIISIATFAATLYQFRKVIS